MERKRKRGRSTCSEPGCRPGVGERFERRRNLLEENHSIVPPSTSFPLAAAAASYPSPQTLLSSGPTLPLTKANLCRLNACNMGNEPLTPANSRGNNQSKGKSRSTTSPTRSLKPSNNAGIRRVLKNNKLLIHLRALDENQAGIVAKAEDIIQADRHSAMKNKEVSLQVMDDYSEANDLTFLHHFWSTLTSQSREVRTQGPGLGDDPGGWIAQAWDKDFLRGHWRSDFNRQSVPDIETTDKVDKELLASQPRVENPRLDLVYGLKEGAFTLTEQKINDTYGRYSMLSPDLFRAFFIVEAKGCDGNIGDAENQCCRGGAAMVNATASFNRKADRELSPPLGSDIDSIAFSLALVPDKAHMFVHWAEYKSQEPKDVVYHMNLVKSYDLLEIERVEDLRGHIHNVLDWGVLKRKAEIQERCKKIADGP